MRFTSESLAETLKDVEEDGLESKEALLESLDRESDLIAWMSLQRV